MRVGLGYLQEQEKHWQLKIVVLDNGAFHKAKTLIIPENIILIFLPPYSPELNPAEKYGQNLKGNLKTNSLKHSTTYEISPWSYAREFKKKRSYLFVNLNIFF